MSIGTSVRRVFFTSMPVPRRQVRINSTMLAPNKIGAQAPSNSLRKFAEKKVRSTTDNGNIISATRHSGHCHNFQTTMKPNSPSTTMVVATAMP